MCNSGTVARHERRAFGPKALYEPNRTGRCGTVLIPYDQWRRNGMRWQNKIMRCVWFLVGGEAQVPSVRIGSPVLTKPHWSFGTVLISAIHVSLVKLRRSTIKWLISFVFEVQIMAWQCSCNWYEGLLSWRGNCTEKGMKSAQISITFMFCPFLTLRMVINFLNDCKSWNYTKGNWI